MQTGPHAYRAFISYSHGDSRVAAWLHRALEAYRVPARIVGRTTASGLIGKRLGKVFRDRDELPVAADLSGSINAALAQSQFLIVLCSPAAARSPWVNQEIVNFKRLRGPESIIAVIASGEPHATDPAAECFPPALRFHLSAEGALTDRPAEPIAADLRPGKDGRRLVRMKVLAGLLGVALDELIRREQQRRARFLFWFSGAMGAAAAAMAGLAVFAFHARNDAVTRRAQAEELIEFMLGDLKEKLQPVGRLDVLNALGARAVAYYEAQKPAEMDVAARVRKARALRALGEIQLSQNALDKADENFKQASALTSEAVREAPKDAGWAFEAGQSAYWRAYVNLQRAQYEAAEADLLEYVDFARQQMSLDNHSPKSEEEYASAQADLGAVRLRMGHVEEAQSNFQSALERFSSLHDAAPTELRHLSNLAATYSWMAEAAEKSGNLHDALRNRLQQLSLSRRQLAMRPGDRSIIEIAALAEREIGSLAVELGDPSSALSYLDRAHASLVELAAIDPENSRLNEELIETQISRANVFRIRGSAPMALDALHNAETLLRKLEESGRGRQGNMSRQKAQIFVVRALTSNGQVGTLGDIGSVIERLEHEGGGADESGTLALVHLLLLEADRLDADHQRDTASAVRRRAASRVEALSSRSMRAQALYLRAEAALGQSRAAMDLARKLMAADYRDPEFCGFVHGLNLPELRCTPGNPGFFEQAERGNR